MLKLRNVGEEYVEIPYNSLTSLPQVLKYVKRRYKNGGKKDSTAH